MHTVSKVLGLYEGNIKEHPGNHVIGAHYDIYNM